ncbi:O-antigen ligase family protein [Clostridium gasigenes]|uniref:O-antigen ligase family protein n=1 Tax=Clostridium gasigenes TaxID=94869 RepID=UPI001C0D68AC|nr:O-antigen ligase family protein [Clostridium gasigenes]MBU3103153.1 O-antigen ligase family protein [Clostridium gasigenes]
MEVTLIGWVVIALAIYAFIKEEKYLLYLAVFFSTFTATSIINIEKSITGIAPFYFLAGLWILRVVINYYKDKVTLRTLIKENKKNKLIRGLFIFFVVVILGELFRFIARNPINFMELNNNLKMTIEFSSSNITQPIYLLFMVIFSMLLCVRLKNKEEIKKIVKIFIASTIFALIWGLAQFCMYYLGVEYPANLFNNNISGLQLHFQMVYGIKRVNSIALEPSTFALNILQLLPLILTLWLANVKIAKTKRKSEIIMVTIIILALMVAVLTTSSTAYVGITLIVVILTIYILFFSVKGKELHNNKKRVIIFYLIGIVSLVIVMLLAIRVFDIYWGTLWDAFKDMTINKTKLDSGKERANAVQMAFEIFKQAPMVGAGWGSFRSLDMLTNLLANTGILGVISFFYIIYTCIKRTILYKEYNEIMAVGLGLMIIIPTIALSISIPDLVFGYYWIGIVVAYNYCDITEEVE